ncbi:hypothetical protein B0H16DRAFT_164543 [Mycena metata]|uniref:Uncharacterized protein n=1 Tax=Mycena metata TaxID=1033252 RepID=A0AAD7MV01_9AGAR|nr:hypothetical protein B0H16DRAFT_164543 [Mycena metata]
MPPVTQPSFQIRTFQLFCGAEDPLGDIYHWQDEEPVRPHILPVPLEPPSPPSKKRKRSTGCGEIIHFGAVVSYTNMWRAPESGASRWVIPLESQYFPKKLRRKLGLGTQLCGCVMEGAGCAVCGNALGVLTTQCDIHQISNRGHRYYTFLPSAVSPPIPPFVPPPTRAPTPPPVDPSLETRAPTLPPGSPPAPRLYPRPDNPRPTIYAVFTPTPSPEILPVELPAGTTFAWEIVDDGV